MELAGAYRFNGMSQIKETWLAVACRPQIPPRLILTTNCRHGLQRHQLTGNAGLWVTVSEDQGCALSAKVEKDLLVKGRNTYKQLKVCHRDCSF
ncbi:MAG: hypothetical protein KBT53_09815 [Porticoccus sp.]|nr:hypothetical protein [Porticoccus sp.]